MNLNTKEWNKKELNDCRRDCAAQEEKTEKRDILKITCKIQIRKTVFFEKEL
jgi:hypothetical protein